MTVTKLRWTTLTISFCLLILGGLAGLDLGGYLPAYACPYVGSPRGGVCFFFRLQWILAVGSKAAFQALLKHLIFFSILVILIGKAWCGWICPFGFVQDLLDLVRRKLKIGYLRFPERLRAGLSIAKWIFFFIALLIPLWVAFPLLAPSVAADLRQPYCTLCPGKYILPLLVGDPGDVAVDFHSATAVTMTVLGLLISIITIGGAFLKKRFWCPYCPMGLLMSWYRKIAFIKLKKDSQKCTMCEVCYNVCPMDIEQVFKEREKEDVTFSDCILCLKCIEYCPEDDALRAAFLGKTIYRSTRKGFFARLRAVPATLWKKKQKALEYENE